MNYSTALVPPDGEEGKPPFAYTFFWSLANNCFWVQNKERKCQSQATPTGQQFCGEGAAVHLQELTLTGAEQWVTWPSRGTLVGASKSFTRKGEYMELQTIFFCGGNNKIDTWKGDMHN